MPNPLNNVTLSGSDYADSATIEAVWGGNGGAFQVKDASVFYVLQYPDPSSGNNRSGFGSAVLTEEREIDPGTGTIPAGVTGIKFRNSNASSPATVSATIAPPNQPVLSLGAPGVVGTASVIATVVGVVSSAGAITAGSGFTVNKTGTGVYVLTFTTAFSTVPAVTATADAANALAVLDAANRTVNTVQIDMQNSTTNAAVNSGFSFIAIQP